MSLLKLRDTFTKRHNKKFVTTFFKHDDFAEDDKLLFSFLQFTNSIDISEVTEANFKRLILVYSKESLPADYEKHKFIPSSTSMASISTSNVPAMLKNLEVELIASLDFILASESDISDEDYKIEIRTFLNQVIENNLLMIFQSEIGNLYQHKKEAIRILEDSRKKFSFLQDRYDITHLVSEYQKLICSPTGKLPYMEVGSWGLAEIDSQLFGIRTNLITAIAAGPGVGKSRTMLAIYAYRSAVYHHSNVYIDSPENSTTMMETILVCHHIIHIYNGIYQIPVTAVLADDLDEEAKSIYESARRDLFESGKYGTITLSDKKVYIDDYRAHMTDLLKNYNVQVYCLDYIGRLDKKIDGIYRQYKDFEIITEGYEVLQDLIKEFNFHACIVNQLNKEGETASVNGHPITAGMMQGGMGIDRYIDLALVLTQTKEQERANVITVDSCKHRHEGKMTPVVVKFNKTYALYSSYHKAS